MAISDIHGHNTIKQFLLSFKAKAPASLTMLFYGPRGVGKTTMAYEFMKFMNCEKTEDACNVCVYCKRLTRYRDETPQNDEEKEIVPDLISLSGEDKLVPIEAVKEIIRATRLHPYEMPMRSILIEGAHNMLPPAANALLKILEEPPAGNLFILVSEAPEAVLPTIRSRCIKVKFDPLEPHDTKAVLVQKLGYSDAEAEKYIRFSPGSLQFVEEVLNNSITDFLEEFVRIHYLTGMGSQTASFVDNLLKSDINPLRFLDYLAIFFADVLKSGWSDKYNFIFSKELIGEIEKQKITKHALAKTIDQVREARQKLTMQGNKTLVLETLFIKMQDAMRPDAAPVIRENR